MRLVSIGWLFFVVGLSLIPLPLKIQLGTTGNYHRLGHFAIFFVTAFLLCWKAGNLRAKLFRAAAVIVLGVVLEWLELFFYHASFEWKDVLSDTGGILLGVCAVIIAETIALQISRGIQL